MSVNQRIKFIIDSQEGGNASKFAAKIGSGRATIASMLPEGRGGNPTQPSFDVLAKIVAAYPTISADWLISGAGEAPRPKDKKGASSNSISSANNSFVSGPTAGSDSGEVQYLRERVKDLEQQLRDQIARNNDLVSKIIELSTK